MTQEEISKNNRLIAEFMGWECSPRTSMYYEHGLHSSCIPKRVDELLFHASWEWLMPVVTKINYDIPTGFLNNLYYEEVKRWAGLGNIDGTYQAVIKFIEWYNSENS